MQMSVRKVDSVMTDQAPYKRPQEVGKYRLKRRIGNC